MSISTSNLQPPTDLERISAVKYPHVAISVADCRDRQTEKEIRTRRRRRRLGLGLAGVQRKDIR